MSININSGFALGAAAPIDDRIVLTKEQMLNIDENVFPDTYFCVCKDDGILYLFNKSNVYLDGLGKFRLFSGDTYYSNCPIGTVLSFAGSAAPHGYLLCDGSSYKIEDYSDLYAVIGNTYGGDTENFNVPDYRETVLVGVGENTTDTIASHDIYELGEFKDDQMESHTHGVVIPNHVGGSWQVNTTAKAYYSTQTITQTSTASGTGTTTHSKQKGVTYIIKAFHTNEGVDSGVSDDVIEYVEREIAEVESEINPTIDSSKVFSDSTLNISTLCSTYGNGRYVIVGQGTAGNGSATIDIWTLASHAISYIVNVTYSNKTSNTFIGLTYENPTISFETNYLSACNHIAKVCALA